MMIYNNGSVSNTVKYNDLCQERFAINLAYNQDTWYFEVENNSMVDLREKYGHLHGDLVGFYSYLSEDDEILLKFFLNHNIIINWIDCNYTWGWFDDETGKWTGAIGLVNISINSRVIKINNFF